MRTQAFGGAPPCRAASPPWRGVPFFRSQVALRGYVRGCACYRRRLVIEVGGAQHGDAERSRHDAVRDTVLAGEGFGALSIASQNVRANLEGVLTALRLALCETLTPAAQPPTLSTRGRENRWS
ncbi:MAG: endonuclease domain-containing protein [Acetobacteraceae bacterium]